MTYSTYKKKLAKAASLLIYACQETPCALFDKPAEPFTCDDCPILAAQLLIEKKEEELETDDTPD